MQYTDDRYRWRVELDTKDCPLSTEARGEVERALEPLGGEVKDLPSSDLRVAMIHQAQSNTNHVECKLKLPGATLTADDRDEVPQLALERCVRKLLGDVEAYKDHLDRQAEDVARHRTALDQDIVAPEEPDAGPLGEAVRAGDYRAFRTAASGYEEWLRKRVGRWVQRYPEAEARLGHGLALGDVVEDVFLNAFEGYAHRPADVPLHDWLDSLIDPSLKRLLRHPGAEHENASLARTLRETPLGP